MSLHHISESDVRDALTYPDLISALRETFAAYAIGNAQMPSKSYIDLPSYNGDFRSMPAHIQTDDWEATGVKWVNVHPDNPGEYDLPTVMATVLYSDPKTGRPLASISATELTRRRTGAVAALATDELARADSSTLGLLGAGAQADSQLAAISTVRDLDQIIVCDQDESALDAFIDRTETDIEIQTTTTPDAFTDCDIVSTTTPATEPVISAEHISAGTHINAMGADAAGKQELDPRLLINGVVVIDDWEQAIHSGEVNVPFANGEVSDSDIHGTLAECVTDKEPGRTTVDDVTVFDSTGLAIQDIAASHLVYAHYPSPDETR